MKLKLQYLAFIELQHISRHLLMCKALLSFIRQNIS